MKKITRKQLSDKEQRGAKVVRSVKEVADAGSSIQQSAVPQPLPQDIELTIKNNTKVTDDAIRSLTAANEKQVRTMDLFVEALEQVIASNESSTTGPIPYDLIVHRGTNGLIDRIRIEPVVTVH